MRTLGPWLGVVVVVAACSDKTNAAGAGADADGGAGARPDPSAGGSSSGGSSSGGSSSGGARGDAATDGANGEGGAVQVDPGPPAVQLIGRFDTRDPSGPIGAWAGSRILARFEGTAVSVTLDERSYAWMDGDPSEWDFSVDDAAPTKVVTTPGVKTYPIATGLAAGPHKVELYKRTEAQNGFTQFKGFDFAGGALLAPPAKSTRRIEIIGDSAASGFGVEGVGYPDTDCPGLDYSAQWQNFRKSFGAVLGATLSAEVHGAAYSGKGIAKNIYRPDPETMPVIYARANPVDASSAYDFAWQADVVVLMMGGNDFDVGQPDESGPSGGPATPTEFTNGYRAFVTTLRAKHPNAQLLLSVSPSVSDAKPAGRASRTNILSTTAAIAAERNSAGDAKVFTFHPTVATAAELTGCNGHGTPAFHQRVAAEFAVAVKQKTGW